MPKGTLILLTLNPDGEGFISSNSPIGSFRFMTLLRPSIIESTLFSFSSSLSMKLFCKSNFFASSKSFSFSLKRSDLFLCISSQANFNASFRVSTDELSKNSFASFALAPKEFSSFLNF